MKECGSGLIFALLYSDLLYRDLACKKIAGGYNYVQKKG